MAKTSRPTTPSTTLLRSAGTFIALLVTSLMVALVTVVAIDLIVSGAINVPPTPSTLLKLAIIWVTYLVAFYAILRSRDAVAVARAARYAAGNDELLTGGPPIVTVDYQADDGESLAAIDEITERLRKAATTEKHPDRQAGYHLLLALCQSFGLNQTVDAAENTLNRQRSILAERSGAKLSAATSARLALPLLGFLGTVFGIMGSLSQLKALFGENPSPDQIGMTMRSVIGELGVAFDTTLVGLVMTLIAMLLHTIYKGQAATEIDGLIVEVEDKVLSRMRNPNLSRRVELVVRSIASEAAHDAVKETLDRQARAATEAAEHYRGTGRE